MRAAVFDGLRPRHAMVNIRKAKNTLEDCRLNAQQRLFCKIADGERTEIIDTLLVGIN